MIGVLDFIKQGHADRVTGAIICEPQDGLICNTQKGAIRARFDITGRMSHGAMPLSGLNTAPAVAGIIQGLHELEQEAAASIGRDPLLGWPSFTPTVIQSPSAGPAQLNVVPGESRLLVDIRTIPGQSHDAIREALNRLARDVEETTRKNYLQYDKTIEVDRDPSLSIDVTFLTDRPCTFTDPGDPVIQAADWATRQVSGREPEYGGVPGATDGTFLWSMKQIPIVTMGAGDRQVPHQVDEWVDLDQLVDTVRIYALAAWNYLNPEIDPS
jgi:succinyl-diaminopimelate desuccinylase